MNDRTPTGEQVRQALGRVVASSGFSGAGRLPGFLTFLVERALEGSAERLKESVLGVEVFGRPADYDPRTDPIVRVEARRLRSRLEDYYSGEGKQDEVRIELPKGGYVPLFRFEPAEPAAAAEVPAEPAAAEAPKEADRWWPRGWRLAAVIALLGVAGVGLGYCQARYMRRVREAPTATVAVLPLANVGGEAENEYFAEGLTEEIIDRLARVPGLKVVARTVMAQFKGRTLSLDEVAAKVGASVVVEGSVRRQGGRLRVAARLVSARDGTSLWSQSYDGAAKDVFTIQEQIAQSVAGALRVRVRGEGGPAASHATQNIEAYNAFLKGRYQLNLYGMADLKLAVQYLEESLRLEPDYAPALEALAHTYGLIGYYRGMDSRQSWGNSKRYAERAIAVDPAAADAHAALGLELAFHEWKWREGEASLKKALELDPASAMAHAMMGMLRMVEARLPESRAEFRQALELNPLSPFLSMAASYELMAEGRLEEAIAGYRKTIELKNVHPDVYWDCGMALGLAGRKQEAAEAFRRSRQASGRDPQRLYGLQAYFSGDEAQARHDAIEQLQEAQRGESEWVDLGRLQAMLGEKDAAFASLRRSLELREEQIIWLKADPRFRSLRGDRRYEELLGRLGLDKEP